MKRMHLYSGHPMPQISQFVSCNGLLETKLECSGGEISSMESDLFGCWASNPGHGYQSCHVHHHHCFPWRPKTSSKGESDMSGELSTLCKESRLKLPVHILDLMEQRGFRVYSDTYASLLQACANSNALADGKEVHAHLIKSGIKPDIFLGNTLVSMYVKCGSVKDARQAFDKMPKRNVISWTAMIAGLAQEGNSAEAFELFWQMQREGVKADKVTFMTVLKACVSPTSLYQGKRLHAGITKAGFDSDVRVATALVTMYCKCGSVADARQVFQKMPKRDMVLWTSMIAGFAQHGHAEEAIELFRQMQIQGIKPDKLTFISVLNACATLAALEEGKGVHADIIKSGFQSDVSVGCALIDMYAKGGSVENALRVFDKILQRDVVSWNAMILAYAQHGHIEEALQLFEQMQLEGMTPNEVTFIGVISACSRMGLVDEGGQYFRSMREYGITPTGKHYGCMVDLLGRAGRLDEAEDFINKMPFKPGAQVWGALLGACRIHGNVELAERAAEHVLKLEPQDSAGYVLLSNIYAAAGRCDEVAKVRKAMEERGVKRSQGTAG